MIQVQHEFEEKPREFSNIKSFVEFAQGLFSENEDEESPLKNPPGTVGESYQYIREYCDSFTIL